MLKGKSAPIAGSWGGIGFATARALAALGCDVVLNGFAATETIAARAANIEALGVKPCTTAPTYGIPLKSHTWSPSPRPISW
jgi:NAD(P)-dependent dehydrogenase (short-subunit alcohol dehydrogenase family)